MTIAFCPQCGHPIDSQMRHGRMRPVCPACRYVHFANPRVAVVMFVAEKDQVLLIKRGVWPEKGRWALVAGFIDLGEHPEEGAIREMKEETGLDGVIERLMDLSFDPVSQTIVILYKARVVGGVLAPNDDAQDARWFTRADLPDLAFDSTRQTVKAWLAGDLI